MKYVYAEGINKRFQAIRQRLDLTQGEIGELLGITPGYYSKLENGEKPVKKSTAILVCKTFDVRMEYLVNGVEPIFNLDDQQKRKLLEEFERLPAPCKDFFLKYLEFYRQSTSE